MTTVWLDVPVFNGFGGLPDLREFPGYRGISGFKTFLLRGNIVDLAVAVVIGTAFTAVVTSFATSFLEPLIALAGGGGRLGGTLSVGGQTFTWGAFLSQVITFVLTAAVVYFVVVLPLHRLLERRATEPSPAAGPTELELLVEIRDLLRAQHGMAQHGMAQQGMAQHGMAQQGMAQQGMAQQGMAQQGMAPPGTSLRHDRIEPPES